MRYLHFQTSKINKIKKLLKLQINMLFFIWILFLLLLSTIEQEATIQVVLAEDTPYRIEILLQEMLNEDLLLQTSLSLYLT